MRLIASLVFLVFFVLSGSTQPLAPQTITPTPQPQRENRQADSQPGQEGAISFFVSIDGNEEIHIQGNNLWYEHQDWELPEKISDLDYLTTIDEDKWVPEWDGYTSNVYNRLSHALPAEDGYQYSIEVKWGRRIVDFVQFPRVSNNYEAVIVLNDCFEEGPDWYGFTLQWTKTPPVTVESNQAVWTGKLNNFETHLVIRKDSLSLNSHGVFPSMTYSTLFGGALPSHPVDVSAKVLEGGVSARILEQPRASNDYTCLVYLGSSTGQDPTVLFTWSEEVSATPIPTPMPITLSVSDTTNINTSSYFPDSNFRQFVQETLEATTEDVLTPKDLADVEGELNCAMREIKLLTGIEFFLGNHGIELR